jgi:hypothetical protein
METKEYKCRLLYSSGDPEIKLYIDDNGYKVPASMDNLSRLLILAGTYYPGEAVWVGDGVETRILKPGKRCGCGEIYTPGDEHERECVE